ncbi:MAG TPA: family 78 glycoside hydrolase catalytic domain [Tepidisphaeraceae bacterium]|nr:family 78 glycoside hydrolase catalytic domain [Tepidisphaeraceae bacterium]
MSKYLIAAAMMLMGVAGCANSMHVAGLRCDARENPMGVDDGRPALGWVNQSEKRGQMQGGYQVLVASSKAKLAEEMGDVWDSGKVNSNRSVDVEYGGGELVAETEYWWKVRTWDQDGKGSGWSKTAEWTQGPMKESDWKGEWIGARRVSPLRNGTPNGYHASETKDANEAKWVEVDLGKVMEINAVVLCPAEPNNYRPKTKGFGFPVRFKVEASESKDSAGVMIADHTQEDFANPGERNVRLAGHGVKGRYVRVTGVKNWVRKDGTACFALAEMRVISGGKNVAEHCAVVAKDSVESAGWGASGLTDGALAQQETPADEYAAPMLRKEFGIEGKIVRATATVCGLGYYELYLNGAKVGDHVLDPGFTAFNQRAEYVMYDVTKELKQGGNVAGVMLGGGWYEMATPDLFGDEHAPWTAPPKVRMFMDVELEGGKHQTVVTDGSWKWSTGEIVFQDIRSGETQDKRLTKVGWNKVGYDDAGWKAVEVVDGPGGEMVAQRQPAIKTCGEIAAVEMTEPKPAVYVYKLGENTAGWAKFTTSGKAGEKITLRFGETLNKQGTIATFLSSHTYGRWQIGEMILSGKGEETFEPRFCYHGFQYVQVEGCEKKPGLGDLVGVRVHTALEPTGTFECSNELINRVHAMVLRTYLNNLQSIPTDCPQREKMGWMCDGMVASGQAMLNFDARTMYEKWVGDMEDAQDEDGSMPSIVPTQGWSKNGHPYTDFQCPWWGGATVVVPWNLYQTYGDERILVTHYEAMRRYVDSLTGREKNMNFGLGDWLEVGINGRPVRTPTELTTWAGYAYFARLVSETAGVLGKKEDEAKYAALSERVRDEFNKKYLREDGRYGDDTQTAPALALVLRLAPENKRDLITQRLVENVQDVRHGHLSTGLVGTLYLFKALQQIGRDDLAFKVAMAQDFPSWKNMMNNGATTLWEAWDGEGSHDHPALGSPDVWFYSGILGIRPEAPGYRRMTIRPGVSTGLEWARGKVESEYGEIACEWRKQKEGGFEMKVSVPVGTKARVYVPAKEQKDVTEAGGMQGVKFQRMENGFAVYEVGSGEYEFMAKD